MTMFVNDIREIFGKKLINKDYVIDKTGVHTLEIQGASFTADEPLIFGQLNQDYIKKELNWYKSISLNVNDIPGGPPEIWQKVSSKNGLINSNYGWCIWSDESNNKENNNGGQYWRVITELQNNPDSRRAIAIYTRPSMHLDYNKDGMSDFICTNTVQYLIRNNVLIAIVQMRSNDVVFGYRNDYAWQKHVAELLSSALGTDSSEIIWQVGSLHVYERHFWMVDSWTRFGVSDMSKSEYEMRING